MAPGQEEQADKKVPAKRRLRLLAVGDVPPFRQEIRNGVRHELEAPKGSIPPRQLTVRSEETERGVSRIQLKRVSAPVILPVTPQQVALMDGGQPWHQMMIPEGQDMLALLWRDPKEGSWGKARSLMLRDDAGFGAGKVRFVNVSPVDIAVILGEARMVIKPGGSVIKQIGVTAGLPLKIVYAQPRGDGWAPLYSSVLVQNRGERGTVVAYRADGKKPRRPVKMITLREIVPLPLKQDKAKTPEKPVNETSGS